MKSFRPLPFLLFGVPLLCACQSPVHPSWHGRVLYEIDSKIQTVVFGPLGEDRHPSFALATADGRCAVVQGLPEQDAWKGWIVHQVAGGLSALGLGEVDLETPGPDLVLGAQNGQVFRLSLLANGEVWVRYLFQAQAPIDDIVVHDFLPTSPGEEALILSEDGLATLLWNLGGEGAAPCPSLNVFKDTDRLRNAVAGPFGPQGQAGVIITGSSGRVTLAYNAAGTWRIAELYKNPEPVARIAVGDLDGEQETREIVIVDDAGLVTLLREKGGAYVAQAINKEEKALRGVSIGDLDPGHPGNEFAVFGYGMEVVLFKEGEGDYDREVLYKDSDKGHNLIAAQVFPGSPGLELVAVGYSGKVNVVFFE